MEMAAAKRSIEGTLEVSGADAPGPQRGSGARALARVVPAIAAAFLGCNLAAAIGVGLVETPGSAGGPPVPMWLALLRVFYHPTDAPIPDPELPRVLLTRAWVHWDSAWYGLIAHSGYWYIPGHQSPVAFFPLYPLTVRMLASVGLNRYIAAVLLTMAAGVAGLLLFHRWATWLVGSERAQRATILLLIYPYSFYLFGAMYSDALYFCVAVGAFYALERGRPGLAAGLGALASATRPIAPAIVLGLVARSVELRVRSGGRVRPVDLVPALAGVGAAAYMFFLAMRFGDPLAFARVQSAPGWENLSGWHSALKVEVWQSLVEDPTASETLIRTLHGVLAVVGLGCCVPLWRRLSRGYALYVAVAIGMPLVSSRDFMGLGRYTIAAFPVFVVIALLLESRPRTRWTYAVVSALGLLLLTIAFAADNFVA